MAITNKKTKLVLLTTRFPFKPGEEFLETEIKFLSRAFEEVHVVPVNYFGQNNSRELPDHIFVHRLSKNQFRPLFRILQIFFESQSINWLKKEIKVMPHNSFKEYIVLFNWLSKAIVMKKFLLNRFINKENFSEYVFYSYWLSPPAIALAMIKEKYGDITAISRGHGFDIYAYRNDPPYLPFQKDVIKTLDKLFVISSDGYNYLVGQNKGIEHKLEVRRLGTLKPKKKSKRSIDGIFRIATCSYLVPVKRLDLLIDALKHCSSLIDWVHIGDGPLRHEIETLAEDLPENIKWRVLGNKTNQEVIDYYIHHPVDLFINVSKSEGIPVSIMEAFSCGIPAIATDVGGVSEIVNQQNGILVNKDITAKELAKTIEGYIKSSTTEKARKSEEAFLTWNEVYNAEKNYTAFSERIKKLRIER